MTEFELVEIFQTAEKATWNEEDLLNLYGDLSGCAAIDAYAKKMFGVSAADSAASYAALCRVWSDNNL